MFPFGGGPRDFLRDIVFVCAADAIIGVSFGVTAVAGGLPDWVPVAMSLLVFAGGSQVATASVLIAGGGPVAAVVAGALPNSRLLPYGFAVADVTGGSWLGRLAGAHLTTDESVAFATRETDPERRRAAFWTCGVLLFVVWNASVVLGVIVGADAGARVRRVGPAGWRAGGRDAGRAEGAVAGRCRGERGDDRGAAVVRGGFMARPRRP